jgi:phosphoserine phosphatase
MFRTKGLRREDFKKIVAGLTITKNLRESLSILKTDGFVTGIISGGIDVFLQELVPDAVEIKTDDLMEVVTAVM